jgi:hypothetical protein
MDKLQKIDKIKYVFYFIFWKEDIRCRRFIFTAVRNARSGYILVLLCRKGRSVPFAAVS